MLNSRFRGSAVRTTSSVFRLKPAGILRGMLERIGITPDWEVIAYCQTHHRSSLVWFVLKHLGYARARGYPVSWSDWGNRDDTPKETA